MKKVLKSKKFLALTLGSVIAGASIIGVAAACTSKVSVVENKVSIKEENSKYFIELELSGKIEVSEKKPATVSFMKPGAKESVKVSKDYGSFDSEKNILKIEISEMPTENTKIIVTAPNLTYNYTYTLNSEGNKTEGTESGKTEGTDTNKTEGTESGKTEGADTNKTEGTESGKTEGENTDNNKTSAEKTNIEYSLSAVLNANNRPEVTFSFSSTIPEKAKKVVIAYMEKDASEESKPRDSEKIVMNAQNKFVWNSFAWNAGKTYVVSNIKFFDENEKLISYDDSKKVEVVVPAMKYQLNLEKIKEVAKKPETWNSYVESKNFSASFTDSAQTAKEIIDPAIKAAIASVITNEEEKKLYDAVSNVTNNTISYDQSSKQLRFYFLINTNNAKDIVDVKFTVNTTDSSKTLTLVEEPAKPSTDAQAHDGANNNGATPPKTEEAAGNTSSGQAGAGEKPATEAEGSAAGSSDKTNKAEGADANGGTSAGGAAGSETAKPNGTEGSGSRDKVAGANAGAEAQGGSSGEQASPKTPSSSGDSSGSTQANGASGTDTTTTTEASPKTTTTTGTRESSAS